MITMVLLASTNWLMTAHDGVVLALKIVWPFAALGLVVYLCIGFAKHGGPADYLPRIVKQEEKGEMGIFFRFLLKVLPKPRTEE